MFPFVVGYEPQASMVEGLEAFLHEECRLLIEESVNPKTFFPRRIESETKSTSLWCRRLIIVLVSSELINSRISQSSLLSNFSRIFNSTFVALSLSIHLWVLSYPRRFGCEFTRTRALFLTVVFRIELLRPECPDFGLM